MEARGDLEATPRPAGRPSSGAPLLDTEFLSWEPGAVGKRGGTSPLWAPGTRVAGRADRRGLPFSPNCSVSVLKLVTVQRTDEPGMGTPGQERKRLAGWCVGSGEGKGAVTAGRRRK